MNRRQRNTEHLSQQQFGEDLTKFIKGLPEIPFMRPRMRTGAMMQTLGYSKEYYPKSRTWYIIPPEQLSREKHYTNLLILLTLNGGELSSKVLADYKKAAQADYNMSISKKF